MITTHSLCFSRKCPVAPIMDHYRLTVTVVGPRVVKVEDILAAVEVLPAEAFQEDLTQILADRLGETVETTGTHSGVVTVCRVNGKKV